MLRKHVVVGLLSYRAYGLVKYGAYALYRAYGLVQYRAYGLVNYRLADATFGHTRTHTHTKKKDAGTKRFFDIFKFLNFEILQNFKFFGSPKRRNFCPPPCPQ